MALVLRFVDKNMDIREEFIAFLQCKWGLSGENLAKLLLNALSDLDLPIEDCRGRFCCLLCKWFGCPYLKA